MASHGTKRSCETGSSRIAPRQGASFLNLPVDQPVEINEIVDDYRRLDSEPVFLAD